MTSERAIVWHRRDLRIRDNPVLDEALSHGAPVPVYVVDPSWFEHELVSDARKEFVLESLAALKTQYRQLGSDLAVLIGDPVEVLSEVDGRVIVAKDPNWFDRERERTVRSRFDSIEADAVVYDADDPRDGWREQARSWFKQKPVHVPESLPSNTLSSDVSIDRCHDRFSIDPDQQRFGEGGAPAAQRRLASFLKDIESYAGCLSSPADAEEQTSHLSPYIRYGTISIREIYQRVADRKEQMEDTRSAELFMDRLVWHQHFRQKLEDNPDLHKEAINPVYRGLYKDERDQELITAWKQGRTGYPLVDASMRALVATGWLSFRMRALAASFFSYILKQWWKIGADFFFRHLIDADVAINYYQWQMQSGLVGVHANRIYDPSKQVREHDPEGRFIRKYVPELRGVPDQYLAEPWTMPAAVQEEKGISIGDEYPEPVVDYEREARRARAFFKKHASAAYQAFEEDQVWQKASLSEDHDRDTILEKADGRQVDLNAFGDGED